MISVRCDKETFEPAKNRAIARRFHAFVHTEDEDPDNKWMALSGYAAADEEALVTEIKEVTSAYDVI